MNRLIEELDKVCRKYRLEEKILIMPTLLAGYELRNALAACSSGWINLLPATVAGLAADVAAMGMIQERRSYLKRLDALQVVEDVLNGLMAGNGMEYFPEQGKQNGLVSALTASIFELRLCGIKAADLKETQFLTEAKARDITRVLQGYEDYLEKNLLVDSPGQIKMAIDILENGKTADSRVYLIPSFMKLSPLEECLLDLLSGGRLIRLQAEPEKDEDLIFPDLGVVKAEFFQAYGKVNEAREVLRRLNSDIVPLDMVTVAYCSSDYIPVFWSLARDLGFNLTVFEGLPAAVTRPGRILLGLINWIKQDFAVFQLVSLLHENDITWSEQGGPDISAATAERLLQRARIGWGRERYTRLHELAEKLKTSAPESETDGEARGHKPEVPDQAELVDRLQSMLDEILQAVPEPDNEGMVSMEQMGKGLSFLVKRLTVSRDELDQAALNEITARLERRGYEALVDWDDALERLENLIFTMGVGRSPARPGSLHLVNYRNLIWSVRPVTYVVGLDADSFPGRGFQDPVLLDAERRLLHPGLKLSGTRPENNQMLMELGLGSRQGKVVMSCSCIDLVENRSLQPAFLILKAFRQLKGNVCLDYSDLAKEWKELAGFIPPDGHALDEGEWWLQAAIGRRYEVMNLILTRFPGLGRGARAREERKRPELTEYDGLVAVSASDYDPRRTGIVLSCSMIEHLAGCPFSYFLRYILNVKPPDRIEYDSERWLQASERGRLLHALYCNFMRWVTEQDEKIDESVHFPVLRQMAEKIIEDYRNQIPPPNDMVFGLEVENILESCDLFIKGHRVFAGCRPRYFEVPFGMGAKSVKEAGCGLPDPVEIELGSCESIRLRGVIDRIDQKTEDAFVVWDYKTGSSRKYEDHQYLCRGRQIQHALYSMAAEKILAAQGHSHPRVPEAGYYFPTEKGEGRRVLRRQDQRSVVLTGLNYLFDLLRNGVFTAAEEKEACVYCDYVEVCGGPAATSRTKSLLATEEALEPWRRLMDIG
ncbi:MAG: hypothetical protein GXY50_03770 [Syntrophomonadaceae bacterium]|nr:hypothetical protein [Syntrophomonadaceae bacterium]